MFKLNDNNTKTRDFYETRILKDTNIFNFQTKIFYFDNEHIYVDNEHIFNFDNEHIIRKGYKNGF